jgi:hypothetical protein
MLMACWILIDKLSNKISNMGSGIHRIDLDKILDLGMDIHNISSAVILIN